MLKRHLTPALLESLGDTPVVFLQGARQTGKSTLVKALAGEGHEADYVTLDDATVRSAASTDAQGFIGDLDGPVIIDEVQRAPGLGLAIKKSVDADRRPGRFLLTGSANAMVLPSLSQALVGRLERHTLWPLSQGEITGRRERFVDLVLDESFEPPELDSMGWEGLCAAVVRGGYPEACRRDVGRRRAAWFDSYVTTILERDVRDLANIAGLEEMPRLLKLLASRTAALLNYADLSRTLAMPQSTLKRYMGLLRATFLIHEVPAWSTNVGKRLVKSPKLMVGDTGLAAWLVGTDADGLAADPAAAGHLVENFVVMELARQVGWSERRPALMHFRAAGGQEVDIVLEDRAGAIVGIEVKTAQTVRDRDFRGLRALAELAGDSFRRGIVLHRGDTVTGFGPRLLALPMAALWHG